MKSAVFLLCLCCGAAGPAASPDIILVTLDTTRADHLSAYGYARPTSPAFDALARRGVLFTRAYTPVPVTLPAHASILTGLVPVRHGVRHNGFQVLAPGIPVLAERLAASGYQTGAIVSAYILDKRFGLARGFETYDDVVDAFTREKIASRTAAAAKAWLNKARSPYFLWVHFFDPHDPYDPPAEFQGIGSSYDGEIAFMDWGLGQLVQAVEGRGKVQPTVWIVAGDHGEMLGDHGEDLHGKFLYEPAVRVPLLMAGSGIPSGQTRRELVFLPDLAPTVLELAGVSGIPGDGSSLMPLVRDPSPSRPSRWIPMETYFPFFEYGWSPLFALCDGSAKYILAPRPEYYDLNGDPTERRNLYVSGDAGIAPLEARLLAERGTDPLWQKGLEPGASLLTAEEVRSLQSLGYLQGGPSPRRLDPREAALDPKDGVALYGNILKAQDALRNGNATRARDLMLGVLRTNPDNPYALRQAGEMLLKSGYPGDAASFLQKAILLYPASSGEDYANLADALAKSGSPERALSAAEQALALDPDYEPAQGLKVHALYLLGKKKEMEGFLKKVLRDNARNPHLLYYGGGAAMGRKDYPKAKAWFHRLLSIQPDHVPAMTQLAAIATQEKRYIMAKGYLERVLQLQPDSFSAIVQLAALHQVGLADRSKALQLYRQALPLAPDAGERAKVQALIRQLERGE
jgi:arylsulfatase A-like enzyme/Tfp pilus assembly protein PilF